MRGLMLVAALALAAACSKSPGAPSDVLQGGVLATFDVAGERFHVWITNPETIAQVLALDRGSSAASIPNGRLRPGSGEGNHNRPFTWHLDPDDIVMAEVTMELCDGRPSYVEANRNTFIAQVGRYCPWGARLDRVQDLR